MYRRELKENEERFTDSNGQKRIGIINYCMICGKKYILRNNRPNSKCCSRECYKKQPTTQVLVTCAVCSKQVYKKKSRIESSKHKIFFCTRKCKDFGQSLKGGIKEIQPQHFGTKPEYKKYREQFIESIKGQDLKCKRCGYNEFQSCIHIHHIDRNRENNDLSNLIMLCANCHFGLHDKMWIL